MAKETTGLWERRALILAFLTIGMATLLVIIEKTPFGMVVLLTVLVASFIYPVKCLIDELYPNTSRRKKWSMTCGGMLAIVFVAILIGIWFWPTSRLRITKETPNPLQPNAPVTVNLNLRNDGRDVGYLLGYRIMFVDSLPINQKDREEMEETLWQKFERTKKFLPRGDILQGEETWLTMGDDALTQDQIARLRPDNSASVYIMGEFQFAGLLSERPLQFCNLF